VSVGSPDPLELALAGDASPDEVLDLVDDAIEAAASEGDAGALAALAGRLDAVAAERGGDWQRLAIAAMRARAVAPSRQPVGGEAPPAAAPPPRDEAVKPVYAGWWIRTAAYLLDGLLLGAAYGLLAAIGSYGSDGVTTLEWVVIPFAYFAGMHAFHDGATVGKAVVGVAVRREDGSGVNAGRAAVRAITTWVLWITMIGGIVDACVLGTDRRKQAVHDKTAGTVVVRTRGRHAAPPSPGR